MAGNQENSSDQPNADAARPLPPPGTPGWPQAGDDDAPQSPTPAAPSESPFDRPPSPSPGAARDQSPRESLDESLDLPAEIDELLEADGSVVIVLDRSGAIRTVNPIALRVLGATSADQLTEGAPAHSMLRSLLDHVPQHLLSTTEHGTWQGDFDHTDASGQPQVFRATVAVRPDDIDDDDDDDNADNKANTGDDNSAGGYIAIIAHDVTWARSETENLRHRSSHDPLTGLSNRRQVLAILERAVSLQRGNSGHVAALFIDLDRLKYVNDALGHSVGDRLLVSTAQRLADAVRPNDHVARIGGDEFLVVCSEMPDTATALELSGRIRKAVSGRIRVRELDLQFSVSVGIALSDPDTLALNDEAAASALISNADTAMYEAKRTGRGRSVLFTAHMRAAARERSELAAAVAHAIAHDELSIEYQPVFSAVTRRASATEALVRWNHPARGRIDPSTFIAVAEESGSIGRLGEAVMRMCLGDLKNWIDAGLVGADFNVHVNVSQAQLSSSAFVNHVQGQLSEHGLDAHRLVLEARESALLSGNTDVQRSVRTLRRLGVGIAVDNFGTGASALSVLTDVGADYLKLDGSLALPSGSSDTDVRLVRALVLLAHALDMQVVAERVSGHEQLRRLQAAGCDFVQGNLLGRPQPSDGHHPAPRWPDP